MKTKKLKLSFEGFPSVVTCLQLFSNTLVSGCILGNILLWDLSTFQKLITFQAHSLKITSLNYHQPNQTLISTSEDCLINIFSLQSKKSKSIETHSEINSAILTPTNTLISAHSDKTVKFWDLTTYKRLSVFHGHKFPVLSLLINKQSTELITGSCDCDILVWNISKMRIEHKFEGHTGYINSIIMNQTETQLFSASSDSLIKVWQLGEKKKFLYNFRGHSEQVTHLTIIRTYLVSCSLDFTLRTWNLQNKICEKSFQLENLVLSVVVGKFLFISCNDCSVRVFETGNFNKVQMIIGHSGCVNKTVKIKDSIVSAGNDGYLKVWDELTGVLKMNVNAHLGGVNDLDVVEGSVVISCGMDKKVKIWDLDRGECRGEVEIMTCNAYCLRVLRGEVLRIVFPFDDMRYCVRNFEGGEKNRFIRVVNKKKGDVWFSRNGKYLVSRYGKLSVCVQKIPNC